MGRVGNPLDGAILAPGALVDLPEVWADRYVANGTAELAEEPKKEKGDKSVAALKAKGKKK